MNRIISVCGLLCNECNFITSTCKGCRAVKGRTFWAGEVMPDKTCPLYACAVIDRRYDTCGRCDELPCRKFYDLKDPNISEEQHKKSIGERVAQLR